jgi:hypothetical protein
MWNQLSWSDVLTWLGKLDWAKILGGLVAPVGGAIFVWWKGGFKYLYQKLSAWRAVHKYKKALKAEVSALIIIGRREGFDLSRMYVDLQIFRSDLMGKGAPTPWPKQFVLVGTPGAGKSTHVKKRILENLKEKKSRIPFFIRLKEYNPGRSIEDLLVQKLEASGLKKSRAVVRAELRHTDGLCVLDGLDEVRPSAQKDIYEAIDLFYNTYFRDSSSGNLIITCRKEAYRSTPLALSEVWEVAELKDEQIEEFARNWPLPYPAGKNHETFWQELTAAPRILEVSRSPLLLVGSLLLYTESNLGIPGERVKYLQKIANTLVEEWGTAQGHPPDPLRNSYAPILAHIALKMHVQKTGQLLRSKCIEYLTELLPRHGLQPTDAESFLENLLKKTGILVADVPGAIIFVQFTLQEFFASARLPSEYDATAIASLEPTDWWREVTLFAVARASDPTPYVNALFATSPMMGALAVTEAPTPSLELQETAINVTTQELDRAQDTATLPIISLLRKVSGQLECDMCAAIGKRLEHEDERVSAIAGRALATSGTVLATETLSRYPAAWKHCLNTSGYLSNTFEKLLINWVQTPTHAYWTNAAELITNRFEGSALLRLTNILEKLPADKADHLASLLVRALHSRGNFQRSDILTLCNSVPYVRDKDALRNRLTNRADPQEGGAHEVLEHHTYHEWDNITTLGEPGLVPTSLVLARELEAKENSSFRLFNQLNRTVIWCRLRWAYLLLLSSIVPALLALQTMSLVAVYAVVLCSIVMFVTSGTLPILDPPWIKKSGRSFFENWLMSWQNYSIFSAGMVIALSVSPPTQLARPQMLYIALYTFIITIFALAALTAPTVRRHVLRDIRVWGSYSRSGRFSNIPGNADTHLFLAAVIWGFSIGAYLLFVDFGTVPLLVLATAVGGWILWQLTRNYQEWRVTRKAAGLAST